MTDFDSDSRALLSEVRQDIKSLSREVGSISTLIANMEKGSQDINDRLNRLEDHVKFTEGALSTVKIVGSVIAGSIASSLIIFGTWVVVSIQDHKMSVAMLRNSIAIIKADQRNMADQAKLNIHLLSDMDDPQPPNDGK